MSERLASTPTLSPTKSRSRRLDRVFLDANVLFSAAYMPDSRLLVLWSLGEAEIITSAFALEEARRNLEDNNPSGLPLLAELASQLHVTEGGHGDKLPAGILLPPKDEPILLAAIASGATHLLTGDKRHFGELFGQTVAGVLIQTPSQYLASRRCGEA